MIYYTIEKFIQLQLLRLKCSKSNGITYIKLADPSSDLSLTLLWYVRYHLFNSASYWDITRYYFFNTQTSINDLYIIYLTV